MLSTRFFFWAFFISWAIWKPRFDSLGGGLPYFIFAGYLLSLLFSYHHLKKGFLFFGTFLLAGRYFYWRLFHTFQLEDKAGALLNLLLITAELLSVAGVFFLSFQLGKDPKRKKLPPAAADDPLSVELFIVITEEPAEAAERTLTASAALEYPTAQKKISLLDLSGREEIRRLADRFEADYLTRSQKSGRSRLLNEALGRSSAESILILQADHLPSRNFLKEIVPFFQDEKLAFVQTAARLVVPDPFQQALLLNREIPQEQALFLQRIEPGLDRLGAAVFTGSGALFRRTALQEIGGFQADDGEEGFHTSLALHRRGWRSAYVHRNLTTRLAAEKSGAFLTHRFERLRSALPLLKKNVLERGSLTAKQALGYAGLGLPPLLALARLIFFLVPLAFVVGIPPFRAPLGTLLSFFLPFYLSQFFLLAALGRPQRHPLWSTVYQTADLLALFSTEEEQKRKPISVAVILIGIQFFSLFSSLFRAFSQPGGEEALFIGGVWAAYNLIPLIAALAAVVGRPQRRAAPRIERSGRCRIVQPAHQQAALLDLSETGLHLKAEAPLPAASPITLEIEPLRGILLKGTVARSEALPRGGAFIGIRFSGLGEKERRALRELIYDSDGRARETEEPLFHRNALFSIAAAPTRTILDEQLLRPSRSPARRYYFGPGQKFTSALLLGLLWLSLTSYLALPWIDDLAHVVPKPFAVATIIFIALLPGFINAFLMSSLLFDRRPPYVPLDPYPPITLLVAAFNEERTIRQTVKSVFDQHYPGAVELIVIDDGSTDNTAALLKSIDHPSLKVIHADHGGKAKALNLGLQQARHEIVITIDADCALFRGALERIVARLSNDPPGTAAVAGAVLARNSRNNWITRIQEWDYFHGIASVKRLQSLYHGTLVAQGAFSAFRKRVLLEVGGWPETVGEDIVQTWAMLKKGYRIGFAENAIVFTNVPETFQAFFRQRRRWARGLIEAFKFYPRILFQPRLSTLFIYWNLLFPVLDLVYLFIFIPGVIAAFFGYYFIAGPMTLAVLPLALIVNAVMFRIQRRMFQEQGLKVRRNIFGFIWFMLTYQVFMAPASVAGYLAELAGLRKGWGTK